MKGASMLKHILRSKLKLRVFDSVNDSGFTLIESLVAAVVVGILLVSIAPMLVLSTASRVQARRVDLANNAARDFVDRLKGGVVAPFPPNVFTTASATAFATAYPNYIGNNLTIEKNVTAIDGNGDGEYGSASDLVIQAVRTPDSITVGVAPTAVVTPLILNTPGNLRILQRGGYEVLVRVYRADAFTFGAATGQTLSVTTDAYDVYNNLSTTNPSSPDINKPASMTELQSTFGGGTGSSSKHRPLAVFRSTVQYTSVGNFNEVRTRLGN
jgi:prepilin-type N-terminal cleavage/methylation domain-containing protein